jgi:hypothetical protein
MNRGEVVSAVETNVGRTDKTLVVQSQLSLVMERVENAHPWSALRSEVDVAIAEDDTSLLLPTLTRKVVEARVIDGLSSYGLIVRDKKGIINLFPNVSAMSSGRPAVGYVEGTTLHLIPPSNDAYVVRLTVLKNHAALTSDSVEISLVGMNEALIAGTTAQVYASLQQYEDSNQWELRFTRALRAAIAKDEERIAEDKRQAMHQQLMSNPTPWLDPFVMENF